MKSCFPSFSELFSFLVVVQLYGFFFQITAAKSLDFPLIKTVKKHKIPMVYSPEGKDYMRMLKVFLLMVITTTMFGCSPGIKRYGYSLQDVGDVDTSSCSIAIKRNFNYSENEVEILGEIKAYDTGFSTECSEAYILSCFCKEGCGLGSDIVNIVDETLPDFFWSTCYRAKAEFIRLKDRQKAKLVVSDPCYHWELVVERSIETERRTRQAMSDARNAGILGGIMGAIIGARSH